MNNQLPRLGRLIRKELSEILRDRRTIVTLILMPLLLYPLLSVAFQQFFLASGLAPQVKIEHRIGFVADLDAGIFLRRLAKGDGVLQRRREIARQGKDDPAPWPEVRPVTADFDTLQAEMRGGQLDLIVRLAFPPAFVTLPPPTLPGPGADYRFDFEVLYVPTSPGGQAALAYIEQRLAAANELDLLFRMSKLKNPNPVEYIRLRKAPLDVSDGGGSMMSLASLVPLILILMTITGAVYPAIDLTAGERERGTLEILVAAPVPRLGLLFAKYVSVVSVAVLTALVNLVAMTLTLLFSGLSGLFPDETFTLLTMVQVFGLLLLFAAFFSAVLLCITSFARSFKEAQAYLIPLMLVSLAPGVMGMMPGLELEDWAAAPLLNIVLLARDLFKHEAELGPALVVIVTTLVYALAAIGLAARIFGAENVLYNEQGSWGDLFRRPVEPRLHASVSAALLCLALTIPLNFAMTGTRTLLIQNQTLDEQQAIFLGPLMTALLFGGLPALFAWRGHLQWTSAFAMVPARWPAYVGGIALGLSLWPLLFYAMSYLNLRLDDAVRAKIEQMAASVASLPPGIKVALFVVPALLEEWFFRGYLYGALRQRLGAAPTIAITALIFGLGHYVLTPVLGRVRAVPSAVMGVPLGMVREASGSIWPGMLLHAMHNGCLALLIQEQFAEQATIDDWWVLAGLAGAIVGAAFSWWGRKVAPGRTERFGESS
jgi:ABC-2 type transport system permease protein/sodium transport system permease protein